MDQETPSNYPLTLRITQELRRRLEILAERRGYTDVTALVRAILYDHAGNVPLCGRMGGGVPRARGDGPHN